MRVVSYDEAARRKKAKWSGVYVDSGSKRQAIGKLQPRQIEVSPRCVERMVDGAYEWRDARCRKRGQSQSRIWDDGG